MKLVESILTRNPCYTAGRKITVKGLMLHSVGCPQPKASVFINSSPYFRLIRQADDFYEIQSRCTKHCWIVQKLSYDRYPVRIYHKHTKGTPYYHRHGHAYTVSSAIRQIKSHDVWQLNGRPAMA